MNFVMLNEQHRLLPEQEKLINDAGNYTIVKVPAEGWTRDEIMKSFHDKMYVCNETGIIFVSPIPLMIALAVKNEIKVGIMHNDKREKKELNGKIISTVAQIGWELIWI